MSKEYTVLIAESYTVCYLVKAKNKEEDEEKALEHDYVKQLTNSPEEIEVLEVEEVTDNERTN